MATWSHMDLPSLQGGSLLELLLHGALTRASSSPGRRTQLPAPPMLRGSAGHGSAPPDAGACASVSSVSRSSAGRERELDWWRRAPIPVLTQRRKDRHIPAVRSDGDESSLIPGRRRARHRSSHRHRPPPQAQLLELYP